MNIDGLSNSMTIRAKPAGLVVLKDIPHADDGSVTKLEPFVGLEFNSAEDAQEFYNLYATQFGFRVRVGQLYRSRVDGSVISRRFVCSKEGFQTNSRTGCPAFIRVQKADSGKWVLANVNKEHNHGLEIPGEICPSRVKRRVLPTPRVTVMSCRTGIRSLEVGPSGVTDAKRLRIVDFEKDSQAEPYKGLEFSSANDAYKFYCSYAAKSGFRVRIGQLFRSKNDGSITSRRFVCSKEGRQHPSRVGCGAYMRIQQQASGKWVVHRLQKEHNHELDPPFEPPFDPGRKLAVAKNYREKLGNSNLENIGLIEMNKSLGLSKRGRQSNIRDDWYNMLFNHFQSRQAEDTGFFYAVEMDDGKCMSVFWADGRSRFSCTQFGDAIVFDTSYRKGIYSVPFASFFGVNHHRQLVLLASALIGDESEDSFTWVFQAWLRAMSGRHPISIVADQDKVIQHSIAHVFPGTHHRFSAWQFKAKEQENLGAILSMDKDFKYEYEGCIFQSQTASEFDSAWNLLISKYDLKENAWLKEMYRLRKSWVPLHIKGTFFAGIPINGSVESYFGVFLTAQTSLEEFFARYEKAVEEHREEERKEDFNSSNLQIALHTKDPIEEQCKELYTITIFKVFQKELLECYSYVGIKINVDGALSRYLVQKCGNGEERNTVAFNASNLNISCTCKMFEFEGILCRHALKVLQILNIRELPSRYILHRWTKNAKHGILRDVDSGGGLQNLKALMLWSLREEARNYIETGAASLERYKLAFEILQEGRRNLCWQN